METTIYTTTSCSFCKALAQWLDSQGIKYKKVITDQDPAGMEEFMSVNDGFLGVPFTVIESNDGTVTKVQGYDRAKLMAALHM